MPQTQYNKNCPVSINRNGKLASDVVKEFLLNFWGEGEI